MDEFEAEQLQESSPGDSTDPSQAGQTDDQGGFDQNAQTEIPEDAALDRAQQGDDKSSFLAGANLDPTKLPPEIQPIFKRMQGAYTRKMQEIAKVREQAGIVERFRNDRDFAFQQVAQWATQNGYSIAPVGQQGQQQAQQGYRQQAPVNTRLVEAIKSNLPPELQWMAEAQAPALMAATQELLQPLFQHTQQQQRQYSEQEYDTLASELSNTAPGWEEHEGQMSELLEFMQGSQMRHPKFGSKHQLLYNLVTGNAAATAQVTKRMQASVKNRPSSGVSTGRTVNNLSDRIRTAKNSQDAFRLAAQAADHS